MLHFEDFPVGKTMTLGPRTIGAEEIVKFARKFDPQPFHLSEEAGKKSLFGGLAASGWHTASIAMRLIFDGFLADTLSHGSPGIPQLRWTKPVRPGDALTLLAKVVEVKPSQSKPDRGIVSIEYEMQDATGETKMRMTAKHLLGRRPTATP
jgi:acyl dehydratase